MDGYVHPDFAKVGDLLRHYTRPKGFGSAVTVYHRGVKVVDAWGGRRDDTGRPWEAETMAMSFSTTKGVTSTCLHILADRGLVDYDAPVAEYWPEFAAAGKERVTVRQAMTHQAGLHRLRGLVDEVDDILDWNRMTGDLATRRPDPPPGTGPGYHAITYGWLIGEVVRRVSGRTMSEFVRTEIAEPLRLDGLHIGLPPDQLGRVAPLMPPPTARSRRRFARAARLMAVLPLTRNLADAMLVDDFDTLIFDPSMRMLSAMVPAVNGVFTARSLARLYAAVALGGTLDGVRLLSPERVAAMSEIQVRRRDYCIRADMRWRLGYHQGFSIGRGGQAGFGHYGYGGSGAMADPDTGISVGYVTNDLRRATGPFAGVRMPRLVGAALAAARKR